MQLLSCYVAVAGDDQNIVVREYDTAVTYPELLVLKALHGGENVRRVADAGDVERDPHDERERLSSLYGKQIVDHVFPGEHTALPEVDRRLRPNPAPATDDVLEPPDEKPATRSHRR